MRLKLFAIVLLLVVGGAAVFVAVGGLPKAAAASTTYLTATAAVADVQNDVAATGAIASALSWSFAFGTVPTTVAASSSSSSSTTSSSAAGSPDGTWTVTTLTAKVGDVVKQGDVLATATNATLAADIVAAKNDWTSARLQQLQASDSYDTAVTGGVTATIRQARSGLLNADNAAATAHQHFLDLRAQATHDKLVAPAAGVVTAVNLAAGAVAPSSAAITVASADEQVTAQVVESDIVSLKLQQPATVTVAAIGADLDGTVVAIAPSASSGTSNGVVSFAVTVALKNPPPTLRVGMTASVTITTAAATGVLAVPAAALRGGSGNYNVLVLGANGTPAATAVTVGLITSSLVEIQSGLTAGDVVVTGTSSTQRTTTGTGGGTGGFVVPGGGGGFGGRGANP